MIVLLYFAFLINAEIPDEFKDLADRAIANSKTKIQREKRVDSALPGDYSFPNVYFKLKRTLSSPSTNDIKGYAIENLTVAIVKRKSFNLNENFVFVDPSDQKLYDMTTLVASDDKVNIYQTKDLTVFDIMTNFNYHGKNDKAISPKINLNWDELNAGPELKEIPQISGFQYGVGAHGLFTIDTNFKFSSISDITLSAAIKINIKSAARVVFQDGDSDSSEEFTLFKLPSIPLKGLGVSIKFVGIEIVIQPYIKCDATMSDVSIKVPNKVNYFKGYEFVGTKKIEITPYSIVDTKWDIRVYNLPEGNTLDEIIEQIKQASFHMVPAIRLYLSVEISLGGIETNFDVGLKVPFAFDFTFDKNKCLFPYLYGNINIGLQAFYYFSGISVTYKDLSKGLKTKTKELIKSSSNDINFFNIDTGKFCIGEANKVMEGSDSVLQQGEDRTYFIENNAFSGANDPIQLVIEAKDSLNNLISARSLPFSVYNNKNVGTHLIVTSSQPPNVYWHFNHYATVKKEAKETVFLFIKKKYTYYQTELHTSNSYSYTVKDYSAHSAIDVKPSMSVDGLTVNGNCKIYYLRDVSINKVFHIEKNSMFITTIPCVNNVKYALITLKKDGSTGIDDTASFYSDTMLSESFSTKGYFQASLDHYQIEYDGFNINKPMLLEINISVFFTRNGHEEVYNLGGISTEFIEKKYYSAADARLDNQNFKFNLAKENNPKLRMYFKTTLFNEQNADVSDIKYCEFDYSKFQKYYYLPTDDGSRITFHFERVQPRVSIKSNLITGDENIIAPVFSYSFNEGSRHCIGNFDIETEKDQFYFILELDVPSSNAITVNNVKKYIIIKCNGVTPLVENVIRITHDVFCIPANKITMKIPFRRIDNSYGKLRVDVLFTELENLNDMNLNPYGQEIVCGNYKYQTKSYIVRKSYKYDIIAYNDLDISSNIFEFPIDDETVFVAFMSTSELLHFIIYLNDVNIEEGEYMVSYDVSYIKQLLNNTDKDSFSVYVTTDAKSIQAIRCKDKIVDINENGFAKFTFDIDEDDEIDFYAVCNDESGRMCEITQTSESGEYQLLEFPNRDGLNITGRGMMRAIIHAPINTSFSYYKTFDGSIDIVRSYSNKTKVTVVVKDFYPNKKTKSNRKHISSEVTDDNYRQFCINDENGNILPFSIKYISENIDVFMKAIGARKDFDITHYDFAENGCIVVDHDALEDNVFNTLPHNIIDLDVYDGKIKYNKKGVSFNPLAKKGKIAGIVVAAVLSVVIIVIAVSILVSIRMKKKKDNSSEAQCDNNITSNADEQNNNQASNIDDI